MSNLTDLLPAGAGGKQVNFVASGTIGNGVTVALNSDGTVEAITAVTEGVGTAAIFETGSTTDISSAYDSINNKVVIGYRDDGNGGYGTAVVGTVSGTSISFGTPVPYISAATDFTSVVFDSSTGKVVIFYRDSNNFGKAKVGTVSGTSISFGAEGTFNSANTQYIGSTYDSTNNKPVVIYRDGGNSGFGTACVGTVSGTSISFGAEAVFSTANVSQQISATFDSNLGKVVISYRDDGNSNYGTAIVGTVSGTSITFGSAVVFESANTIYIAATFDSTNNKVVIVYRDAGNADSGTAVVGTVSGTGISFGTPVVFNGDSSYYSATYDASAKKIVISYRDDLNVGKYGTVVSATVSGTSISFDTPLVFEAASVSYTSAVFDSSSNKVAIAYKDIGNSSYGTSVVFTTGATNNTSFIGIADAAISDTASGSVTIKGGVATNNNLIADSISANTAAAFETGNASLGEQRIVYDTANNKAVVLYADTGNSTYLTAVVGTVSGAAISFGTPVVLQSNEVGEIALAYDANAQKVVAAYKNNAVPFPGRAKVGTVSGTSISFGSAVDFHTGSIAGTDATYDSTSQKVILSYGSSAGGHLIVGTISGTSISFGTEYDFTASAIDYTAVTYDTNAQKVVLAYTDSGNSSYGTAAVGTVSGTSISVGSATVLTNFVVAPLYVEYEPVAQKTVVAYANRGVSPPDWSARVGTVSGTTISFGTETAAGSSGTSGGLTFDTSTGYMIQAYQEASSGTSPVIQISTVSGTDITFGGSLSVLTSEPSAVLRIAYDPDTSQIIGINKVDSSSSVGRTFNVNQGLTPNSTYYVQSDGTLATTSSSVLAGKALSSTSINLDYTT